MSGRRRGGFDESILVFLKLNTMFETADFKAILFWIGWITIKTSALVPLPRLSPSLQRKSGITFL